MLEWQHFVLRGCVADGTKTLIALALNY